MRRRYDKEMGVVYVSRSGQAFELIRWLNHRATNGRRSPATRRQRIRLAVSDPTKDADVVCEGCEDVLGAHCAEDAGGGHRVHFDTFCNEYHPFKAAGVAADPTKEAGNG